MAIVEEVAAIFDGRNRNLLVGARAIDRSTWEPLIHSAR